MTYAKLVGYGLLLAVGLSSAKAVFFSLALWDTSFVFHCVFWVLVVAATVAAVQQLGYITVLEALVVLVVWLLFHLISDALIAGPLAGFRIFIDPAMAVGYVLFASSIIFFHPKKHVQRRKQRANK